MERVSIGREAHLSVPGLTIFDWRRSMTACFTDADRVRAAICTRCVPNEKNEPTIETGVVMASGIELSMPNDAHKPSISEVHGAAGFPPMVRQWEPDVRSLFIPMGASTSGIREDVELMVTGDTYGYMPMNLPSDGWWSLESMLTTPMPRSECPSESLSALLGSAQCIDSYREESCLEPLGA